MKKKIIILFTYLGLSLTVFAQSAPDSIYSALEKGITNSKVENFTKYIKTKAYLSLINNASAYYSQSQAHYVLKEFFNVYEPVNFKFNHKTTQKNISYATGIFQYYYRGSKKQSDVFVSLEYEDGRWQISQLTIN